MYEETKTIPPLPGGRRSQSARNSETIPSMGAEISKRTGDTRNWRRDAVTKTGTGELRPTDGRETNVKTKITKKQRTGAETPEILWAAQRNQKCVA